MAISVSNNIGSISRPIANPVVVANSNQISSPVAKGNNPIQEEKSALRNQISRSLGPENITFDNPAYSDAERTNILKLTIKKAKRLLWLEENYPENKRALSTAHFYLAKSYFWYWRNQDPLGKFASLNHYSIMAKEHYNESISILSKVIRTKCEKGVSKNLIAGNGDYLDLAIAFRGLAELEYTLNDSDSADNNVEKSNLAFQNSGERSENTGLEEIDKRNEKFNRNYHKQSVLNLGLNLDASKKASKAVLSTLKVGGLEALRRFLFDKVKIVELLAGKGNQSTNNQLFKALSGMFAKIKAFNIFYVFEIFEVVNLFFEGLASSETTIGISRIYEDLKRNIFETASNLNWKLVRNFSGFDWP